MFSYNRFGNSANRTNTTKTTLWILSICILFSVIVGFTIAFFYKNDWASNNFGTSGPVNIEAVGVGDISIEDANTCNLVVSLDDNYDVLIPGMPINLTANCKVYQSNTKPLLRAMLSLDLLDQSGDEFDEDSNLETSRLMIAQNMINQLNNQIETNGWYLHTDGFYYFIGTDNLEIAGGGYTNC
ncbi:MAG: hypothetical protein ACI4PF_04925 [Christensenellales bacterium]